MQAAATVQEYERAARLRDDIGALRRAMEKNAVVLGDGTDADVIALAEDPLEAAVQVFHVRGGRVRGQRGFVVDKVEDVTTGDLVEHFLQQLYGDITDSASAEGSGEAVPREVLVPELPGRRRRGDRMAVHQTGFARGPASAAARGQEVTDGDRRTQRAAESRAAQDETRERSDDPFAGPAGNPDRFGPGRSAAAYRVLRRLEPAGHRGRRVDGGLRGRAGPAERVPDLQHQGVRRPERRRRHRRGHHPPLPSASRRSGRGRRGPAQRPDRPGDRQAAPVRVPAQPRGGRRRRPAGRGRCRGTGGPAHRTTSRSAGWPSGSRRSGCRARSSRESCRAPARACTCCSGSGTRLTGSPSPTTASAGRSRWSTARSTPSPGSVRCAARR